MKTIITSSLLLASVLGSQISFASENLNVEIINVENQKALVEVSHDAGQSFEINIFNPDGENIFTHETSEFSTEFKKKFDFSRLDEGTYKLSVSTEGGSKEQMMTIDQNGISYGKEITKTDPFFAFKSDMLKLSFINHQNESMKIYVYGNNELIFEKNLSNEMTLSKAFDFSKLKNGEYEVVFAAGNDVYEYSLMKK
jgi:hypothetical protein